MKRVPPDHRVEQIDPVQGAGPLQDPSRTRGVQNSLRVSPLCSRVTVED